MAVRYTPRLADLVPDEVAGRPRSGPPPGRATCAFDHHDPATRTSSCAGRWRTRSTAKRSARRAGEHGGRDRGIVPPALQGHTPDIALRFDPDGARDYLRGRGSTGGLASPASTRTGGCSTWSSESWRRRSDVDVDVRTWTVAEAAQVRRPSGLAPVYFTGWLPGYPDPEYYLRLLFQSDSRTNEGGFSLAAFDELIERARQERSDRSRLELFHEADRMAVADRVAVIPLVYGRSWRSSSPGCTAGGSSASPRRPSPTCASTTLAASS